MPGRISSIRDLCAAFGIHCNSSIIHNMPSFEQRSNLLNWESDGVPGAMKNVLRLYDKIFHAVAAIVCGPKAAQCSIDAMLKKEQITEERNTADNLLSNIKEVICSTKRSSLERRTATSILCSSCSTYQKDGVIGLQLNRRSFSRAKKDFRSMTTAGYLSPSVRTLKRFSTDEADFALSFILSSDNVSFWSWGTKTITFDGIKHSFPRINRKKSRTIIYEDYVRAVSFGKKISRTNFFQLLAAVTYDDPQLRSAVDYVTGILVNENFETVKRIIETFMLLPDERQNLLTEVEHVLHYVKHGFSRNLTVEATGCIFHNIKYGLSENEESCTAQVCTSCQQLHSLFLDVKKKLSSTTTNESALVTIDNCYMKAVLFMGHRISVSNQKINIQEIFNKMKKTCESTGSCQEAVVVIDYKMKMQPIYYRETTLEHYGKRGMSWHGAMLQFYSLEQSDGSKTARLNKIYFDHISENGNKQDKASVFSMVEAIVIDIVTKYPNIKEITLVSDNASNYQNTMILLVLPMISYAYGLMITR